MYKVSLILTTYNCIAQLKGTLKSISSQNYPYIEIIIVDGLSTDGTKQYIENFSKTSKLPVRWISEKDNGIYDAMNKGYALSTGEIIAFFNDKFVRYDTISLIIESIRKNPDCIGAHGDLIFKKNNKVNRRWKMKNGLIKHGWMPAHPTLYLKREIFEKYGLFDTTYTCAADYEFMVRVLKSPNNYLVYVPKTLVSMYYGGTSTGGFKNYITSLREGHRALSENKVRFPFVVDFLRIIRFLLQFIV